MSKKADYRFPLRLDDLTRWKIEYWYKRADCESRNAFVEKAVNFYADIWMGNRTALSLWRSNSLSTVVWECSGTGCPSSYTS